MKSKKLTFITAAFLLILSVPLFANVVISDLSGRVEVLKSPEGAWNKAQTGMQLSLNDQIKTSSDGRAELSFLDGTKVWIKEGTEIKILQLMEKGDKGILTRMKLLMGKVMAKVAHKEGSEFITETPSAVMSVRGTQFIVIFDQGEISLIVLEGKVDLKSLVSGESVLVESGNISFINVGGNLVQPRELNEGEKEQIQKEWSGAAPPEGGQPKLADKIREAIRQELKEAIADIRLDIDVARNVIEETRENDASTGRTLRDVHGNLVRIEQYVMRPKNDVFHFVNITKRSNYKYAGRMNVRSTGSRLDVFEFKAQFNMNLPEKVSEWFSFFKDIDDKDLDFHPLNLEFKITNQSDSIIVKTEWDNARDDFRDPDVWFVSAVNGTWYVDQGDYEEYSGMSWDGMEELDRAEMWGITPRIRLFKDSNHNKNLDYGEERKWVRVGMESWLINNDGKVLSKDILSGFEGTSNPFQVLRSLALESSLTCRYGGPLDDPRYILNQNDVDEDDRANQNAALLGFKDANDLFLYNFDLVVTPDFAIPILEQVAEGAASSM